MTVRNWERIEAGSEVLPSTQVEQLLSAMASFSAPKGVGNVLPAEVKEELPPLLAETLERH